jgi:hypothetical protein
VPVQHVAEVPPTEHRARARPSDAGGTRAVTDSGWSESAGWRAYGRSCRTPLGHRSTQRRCAVTPLLSLPRRVHDRRLRVLAKIGTNVSNSLRTQRRVRRRSTPSDHPPERGPVHIEQPRPGEPGVDRVVVLEDSEQRSSAVAMVCPGSADSGSTALPE